MKPAHALLLCAAGATLLVGCANRQKAPPALAAATPPPAQAEAPPADPTDQPPRYATLQAELAATAGDRIYFALDSEVVESEARETLRQQAAWLRGRPDVRARIAGNADERGPREYNLALGARRAAAARQMLIGLGVAGDRLETVSYGKERPLDAGSGETAWARNRNAHTVVVGLGER